MEERTADALRDETFQEYVAALSECGRLKETYYAEIEAAEAALSEIKVRMDAAIDRAKKARAAFEAVVLKSGPTVRLPCTLRAACHGELESTT